jgi:ligand-binding sensor domain-containing protein
MYQSTYGAVPHDPVEAFKWIRKGADGGDASAQSALGTIYATGFGAPVDIAEAIRWTRKVAEQGNATAQYNLGMLYEIGGPGVAPDYAEARRWYESAAKQGDLNADVRLKGLIKKIAAATLRQAEQLQLAERQLCQADEETPWTVFTSANSDLPQQRIVELAEAEGVLWVGTWGGGIARCGNGKWSVYNRDNSSLPGDVVTALTVAGDGAVWVATVNSYGADVLARLHRGEWQTYLSSTSKLPGGEIQALAAATDGTVWIGTSGYFEYGLARFQEDKWRVYTGRNSNLPNGVLALAVAPDNTVWVGTSDQLGRPGAILELQGTDEWQIYPTNGASVQALAVAVDGSLWAGTSIGLWHLQDEQWQAYTQANSDIPNDHVQALAFTPDGALWVGTRGDGLARFQNDQWQVYTQANSKLPDDDISALAVADDGALWIGTSGGLALLRQAQ